MMPEKTIKTISGRERHESSFRVNVIDREYNVGVFTFLLRVAGGLLPPFTYYKGGEEWAYCLGPNAGREDLLRAMMWRSEIDVDLRWIGDVNEGFYVEVLAARPVAQENETP